MTKRCSVCGEHKPTQEFSRRTASPDGLAYKCRACSRVYLTQWRADHPGAFKAWYQANREHRRVYWSRWSADKKTHLKAAYAAWAKLNKPIINALIAKRTARKKSATPAWADMDAILAIYEEAARRTAETGVRHEVDHIYPLQSDVVCGLHCPANLQILTKTENIRKGNRIPDDRKAPCP